jgi:hypothetical protein
MGEACAGVVRETETSQKRGALVARWATNEENEQLPTTVVDKAYVLGSIDESGEIVTSYDYDVEQRGLGLRLGDCNMGVFESDIELPYVADWSFLLTTKHDASSGADSSDYMDFYIRQDGDEEYIFLSRHMNDADKSTPVRLPTSTRFGLKVVAQSSNAAMPNHMRIQTGPIGTSERPGDLALVYSITGPDCIEHLTEETSSDKDTKAVHNGRGNVHAAYCALALFQIDRYTGQLAVRTANVLDVGIQSTYPVEVTATDPTGLTATARFDVEVIESNDPPEMYQYVIHVDENSRGVEMHDLSHQTDDHWTFFGSFVANIGGDEYPGVLGYVGSPSDVRKGQQLKYTIVAGNVNNQFA